MDQGIFLCITVEGNEYREESQDEEITPLVGATVQESWSWDIVIKHIQPNTGLSQNVSPDKMRRQSLNSAAPDFSIRPRPVVSWTRCIAAESRGATSAEAPHIGFFPLPSAQNLSQE